MTKTVDQWAAEQAGVIIGKSMYTLPDGKRVLYPFTLNDARCREIFRNWWLKAGDMRQVCFSYHSVMYFDHSVANPNVVIAHALNKDGGEEACLTSIYEASQ